MTKWQLAGNTIQIKILSDPGMPATKIEIRDGIYEHARYFHLVINGSNVILEGPEPLILATTANLVEISVTNPLDIACEALGGEFAIYTMGIDAVPQGTERRILAEILGRSAKERLVKD